MLRVARPPRAGGPCPAVPTARPIATTPNAPHGGSGTLANAASADLMLNGAVTGSGALTVNSPVDGTVQLGGNPSAFTGTINSSTE